MRRKFHIPTNKETRVITRFLLFPKQINGEIRWLERASIKQEYSTNYADDGWHSTEWID